MCLPETDLRNEILDHISTNTEAHFKSQQIGDPELTMSEKRNIAESILNKSISLFLTRFGKYLSHEQIELFQNCPTEDEYTVQFYLEQSKRENLKLNEKQVKNRRFEAMNQLLEEGSYFSEHEMKSRNPLLYEHLVGQYMTQEEKDQDDRVDTSNISFVNLLLHQIDKDNEESFKQEQVETEKMESMCDDDTSPKNSMAQSSSNLINDDVEYDTSDEEEVHTGNSKILERTSGQLKLEENEFEQVPPKSKSLWGEEMSDQPLSKPVGMDRTPWATSYGSKPSTSQPSTLQQVEEISEDERILLFQEFRSHMMNDFLEGKEKSFDYSKVDSNPAYDNLTDKNQDAEDKYFDEDESSNSEMQVDTADHPMSKENSSDDELDQFMNSLKPEILMQDINSKIKHM
uniref:Coiled-coil domain-containing protein 97 n=1 Tax=Cacopsylla melanoneura TaxID=428564 RepID=A0A8D8PY43_9HEMI